MYLFFLSSPSVRFECITYANRQNAERLKHAVQQEALFSTSNNNNASPPPMPTNILCKYFEIKKQIVK